MFPLDVLGEPVWQRLTWTLLHLLWQGLAVAAVVATVLYVWPVRHAHNRYLIYLSALIAMAACPLVTFMVVEVPKSATVAGGETEMEIEVEIQLAPNPRPEFVATEIPVGPTGPAVRETPPPLEPSETAPTVPARTGVEDSANAPVPLTWEAELRQYVDAIQPYALIVWIAGVLLLVVRLSLSWLRVRWLAWGRRVIPADLAAKAATLGSRLGLRSPPRVCVSDKIREAIVVGLWRPLVLLPVSWLTEMPPEVLEAVIAHELAHVRRLDLWVNLLQRLVETLLFYHPAVWWLSRRVGLEREMCADELAVSVTSERLLYATALEQLGRMRLGETAPQFGANIGGNKMLLLSRVENILGLSASSKRARWWPVALLALAVPMAIWLASMNIVSSTENETRAEEVIDDTTETPASEEAVGETEKEATRAEVEAPRPSAVAPPERWKEGLLNWSYCDNMSVWGVETLTVDECGVVKVISSASGKGGEDRIVPRGFYYETRLGHDDLDALVKLLWDQRVWELGNLPERKLPPPPDTGKLQLYFATRKVHLERSFDNRSFGNNATLGAIREHMNRLMTKIVAKSRRQPGDWGKPVDGLQTRLRAEQPLRLALDVRHRGDGNVNVYRRADADGHELEVDGRWYKYTKHGHVGASLMYPKHEWYGVAIPLEGRAWELEGEKAPLKIAPGKHVVRVKTRARRIKAERDVPGSVIEVISNPVEVTIERALPGARLSIDKAIEEEAPFAAVCEAVGKWVPASGAVAPGGTRVGSQEFKVVEVLFGKAEPVDRIDLVYKPTGRPIAVHERVIWIGHTRNMSFHGSLYGLKALPDTPKNRQAVKAAAGPEATRGKVNEGKWSDETIDFTLRVIEGTAQTPFVAEIVIANRTDRTQSVPTPFIMPLCGDTNKNNIRVFDKEGNLLKMRGKHGDGFGRPSTELPAKSSVTWRFALEKWFADMADPGTYQVEPWYFSDHTKWSSWVGRVKMQPLTVVRRESLEPPWGKPVDGVSVRLTKAIVHRQPPYQSLALLLLHYDARNNGSYILHLPKNGLRHQVEVDGQWYEWVDPRLVAKESDEPVSSTGGSALLDFEPGRCHRDGLVNVAGNWRAIPKGKEKESAARIYAGYASGKDGYGKELVLTPGKHRVRVAVACPSARAPFHGIVRAASEAVEVEVVAAPETKVPRPVDADKAPADDSAAERLIEEPTAPEELPWSKPVDGLRWRIGLPSDRIEAGKARRRPNRSARRESAFRTPRRRIRESGPDSSTGRSASLPSFRQAA